MQPYKVPLEKSMKALYDSLSEKDRRRSAGIEALKLGQGGRNYIAQVLGCSRRTVTKGAQEGQRLVRARSGTPHSAAGRGAQTVHGGVGRH